MKKSVIARNVSKKFKLYKNPSERTKDLLFGSNKGKQHYALRNISFEIESGEIVGIVGLNGSGKSTLSNIIAGVSIPASGSIEVNGSAALIAIAAGLNNALTGIENIKLKGLMLGLTNKEITRIIPLVIEFADIGDFMYQPVKTYSSGMRSRLGFAISVHINPDIIVVDEALSVGDPTFTNRCLEKMNEFKNEGKTIFFISHSINQIRSFCTKGLWLHYGQNLMYGDVAEVCDEYEKFLSEHKKLSNAEKQKIRDEELLKQQEEPEGFQDEMPSLFSRQKWNLSTVVAFVLIIVLGYTAFYAATHEHKAKRTTEDTKRVELKDDSACLGLSDIYQF